MATRHSTGARRARLCSLKPSLLPVPDSLRDVIETERQKLFKESALLECPVCVARHEDKGLRGELAETGSEHLGAANGKRKMFALNKAADLRGAP